MCGSLVKKEKLRMNMVRKSKITREKSIRKAEGFKLFLAL